MAAALQRENIVLRKADTDWEKIDHSDRDEYWAALVEQRRVADQIKLLLEANPTWVKSVCAWYESVVWPAEVQCTGLRQSLIDRAKRGGDRSRHIVLLFDAAPSEDAAKDHLRYESQHPASPTNLYIMCVKFGHMEEQ